MCLAVLLVKDNRVGFALQTHAIRAQPIRAAVTGHHSKPVKPLFPTRSPAADIPLLVRGPARVPEPHPAFRTRVAAASVALCFLARRELLQRAASLVLLRLCRDGVRG